MEVTKERLSELEKGAIEIIQSKEKISKDLGTCEIISEA